MTQGAKPPRNNHRLRFADFTVDLRTRELHRNGTRIRLQEQPFQVLALLTRRSGEVVTREELRQHLWPADTFVDFDNSLNAAVAKIREALADSPEEPRFIETLPRRGYRFIASTNPVEEDARENTPPTTVAAVETSGERSRPKWWAFALLGLASVAIAPIVLVLRSPQSPKVVRYVRLTNDGTPKVRSVSFLNILVTDGPRVYFARGTGNGWQAAQVSVTGGEPVSLPSPSESLVVNDISRDHSKLLVSFSEGTVLNTALWELPLPGGAAERLGDVRSHGATWSANGKLIAYCKDKDLYVANADGSEPRKLATFEGLPFQPQWSPDGRLMRFFLYDTNRDSGTLWEINSDGSNLHPLLARWQGGAEACCGVWTPDGKYFVFQATHDGVTSVWVLRESKGLWHSSAPEPEQLTFGPMNFLGPSPSPDGKQLFAIGEQKRGELMRYDSGSRRFVTYLSGVSAEGLDFSPDGELMVYVAFPEGTLWRSKIDGSQRIQLTQRSLQAALPRWSPDGKRIVFMGLKQGRPWKSYLISADGGSPEELIPDEGPEWQPGWSPDGNTIIFGGAWWSQSPTVHLLDMRSRRVSTLPGSEGLFFPRWSPNGRFVVACTKDSRTLMLFDFNTQKWEALITRDSFGYLTWSRNSQHVYFDAATKDGVSIYRVGIRDHRLERVASMPPPIGLAFGLFGPWTGLDPDDSPLLMRDTSIQEIYALDWQLP